MTEVMKLQNSYSSVVSAFQREIAQAYSILTVDDDVALEQLMLNLNNS